LLTESFSGPIAFLLAQTPPDNLKSVIFVASFLSTPHSGILKTITRLPLFSLPPPEVIIKHLLLGNNVSDRTISLFAESLKRVSANVLTFRLSEIEELSLHCEISDLSCCYIQAKNDKLVSAKSIEQFERVINNLGIFSVKGSHFIMQTQPERCAEIVVKEMQERSKK